MKVKYIYLFLLGILSVSCFNDDTTFDIHKVSEIYVDTLKMQKIYNIDKNQTLVITPEIRQTEQELPLTYEWQINYEIYTDSLTLRFPGEKLGTYPARLKVSNAQGSFFYQFTIHVNSPYEEGIAVLSEGTDGSTQLSFMRKYSAAELAAGAVEHFETHCLIRNNPEVTFAGRPSDMGKRLSQLFICCKDQPTVYAVNAKTFEVENIITAPEHPDFIPTVMQIPDNEARTAITLCEDGKVFDLSTYEGIILPHSILTSTYSQAQAIYYTDGFQFSYLWDYGLNTLTLYNGYESLDLSGEQIFTGHEPVAIFNNTEGDCLTLLSRYEGQYMSTTVGMMFYNYEYDEDWNLISQTLDLREQRSISGNPPLTPSTPNVASTKYKEWIYAQGNKLYRWYFSDDVFPTSPWATIEMEGAEITSLALSPDQTELYVGVYQPNKTGLNGHFYILNSDTGKILGSPYTNMAGKPVKILYKIK